MSEQTPPAAATDSKPLRNFAWIIAGVIAGMLVALVLVIAVELASAVVHPLPADFGGTQEEMCAHVARYPAWVLALVVPAWGVIALAGTWTAGRLGGRGAALLVGLLLIAGVLWNISMLPYPMWFKIASPVAVIAAVVAGSRRR
jgi:hypothetical protein